MSRLVAGLRVDRSLHVSLRFACSGVVQIGGWPQGRQVLACISVIRLLLHGRRDVNQLSVLVRTIAQKINQLFFDKKKGRRPDVS